MKTFNTGTADNSFMNSYTYYTILYEDSYTYLYN